MLAVQGLCDKGKPRITANGRRSPPMGSQISSTATYRDSFASGAGARAGHRLHVPLQAGGTHPAAHQLQDVGHGPMADTADIQLGLVHTMG